MSPVEAASVEDSSCATRPGSEKCLQPLLYDFHIRVRRLPPVWIGPQPISHLRNTREEPFLCSRCVRERGLFNSTLLKLLKTSKSGFHESPIILDSTELQKCVARTGGAE